jgi:tetratricopeptide (TPR) repeat protein
MASKISNVTELFHKFHTCEMNLKQGKIAACLIGFKEVIEKSPAIPKSDREKGELNQGIESFLKALSGHQKFKEIFGDVTFGDTDLATNLEFIKSMIVAQEQDIVERIQKDEELAEGKRLDITAIEPSKQEVIQQKIKEAIKLIDENKLSEAMEIISGSEEVQNEVVLHYNGLGMKCREEKQFDEAVSNYGKAISASPQDENLYYNVARAYFDAGKFDRATDYLGKSLKINSEFKEGKAFYNYLLKLNPTMENKSKSGSKTGGIFQRIFHSKKSSPSS